MPIIPFFRCTRDFSRKVAIQLEVSVDLLVGVQKPWLQWYCWLLSTDILWSTCVLCFCSGSVTFIRFDPSALDNKMEAGESLICCCLFDPQTSYVFVCFSSLNFRCFRNNRGKQRMRDSIY